MFKTRRVFLCVTVLALLGFAFPAWLVRTGIKITSMCKQGDVLVIEVTWTNLSLDSIDANDAVAGGTDGRIENPRQRWGADMLRLADGWKSGDPIHVRGWRNGAVVALDSGSAP